MLNNNICIIDNMKVRGENDRERMELERKINEYQAQKILGCTHYPIIKDEIEKINIEYPNYVIPNCKDILGEFLSSEQQKNEAIQEKYGIDLSELQEKYGIDLAKILEQCGHSQQHKVSGPRKIMRK